jgi:hypothetical protein
MELGKSGTLIHISMPFVIIKLGTSNQRHTPETVVPAVRMSFVLIGTQNQLRHLRNTLILG